MDATASGAQGIAGRVFSVSDRRRADERRCKLSSTKLAGMRTRSGESFGETGADGEVVWS